MEIDRIKKLAGLNESDSLSAEIKRAEVERTTDTQEKPKFKGLLSGEHDENSEGFSFLKSLRKGPVEEAGNDPYADDSVWERGVEAAHEHYDDAFGFDYIKTEAGQDDTFPEILSFMKDSMVDPEEETRTVQDWADAFQGAWDTFSDKILDDAGIEFYYEEGNKEEYYHYTDLKLDGNYKRLYADEFAKWARAHQNQITSEGFSMFPEIGSGEFANMVAPKLKESAEPEKSDDDQEDIEDLNEDLYNEIIAASKSSNIKDKGITVGYVMEKLNITKTEKNIALVESVILKK